MDWRTDQVFPKAKGYWQFWRPPFGREGSGELGVKKAIWQWHPWDPILIATPNSVRLMPPICVPEIAEKVHKRMLYQYAFLILVVFSLTALAIIFYINNKSSFLERMIAAGLLIISFTILQYIIVFRDIKVLCQTSRFVSWVYLQKTNVVWTAMIVMVVVGLIQCFMEKKLGGFESFITKYGLVFDSARSEPWRYFVGPFFHGSVAHWFGNVVLLVVATGLSAALAKRYAIIVIFLVGLTVPPFIFGHLPAELRADAFGGVSGGICALLGWVGGFMLRNGAWFPPRFGWVVVAFTLMFAGLSWAINPQSGDLVHGMGLVLGLTMGFANFGFKDLAFPSGHSLS